MYKYSWTITNNSVRSVLKWLNIKILPVGVTSQTEILPPDWPVAAVPSYLLEWKKSFGVTGLVNKIELCFSLHNIRTLFVNNDVLQLYLTENITLHESKIFTIIKIVNAPDTLCYVSLQLQWVSMLNSTALTGKI